MKDMNGVQLLGRLGQDPDVQYIDRGTARTLLSVAISRSWTSIEGQAQTETEWTRCITWGTLAEISAQFLHNGNRVYVAGRLHTSQWEDAQTSEQRSSVKIVVDDLILLNRPCQRHRRTSKMPGKHSRACQRLPHAQANSTRSADHPNRSTSAIHRLNQGNAVAPTAAASDRRRCRAGSDPAPWAD